MQPFARTWLGILRTLRSWKLVLTFTCLALCIAGIVWALSTAGLWTRELISETSFWFLFVGIPILFRAVNAGREDAFFKKTALSAIASTALLEFVFNLRPFSLWVELLMVLPLLLLFGTLAYSETTGPDTHTSGVLLGFALAVLIFFGGYTFAGMVSRPNEFFTYVNLLELLLPIILTLGTIPFMYAFALVTTYGTLFTRLAFKLDGHQHRAMRRYAKWSSLRLAHVSLERVHRLATKAWCIGRDDDKAGIDVTLKSALRST